MRVTNKCVTMPKHSSFHLQGETWKADWSHCCFSNTQKKCLSVKYLNNNKKKEERMHSGIFSFFPLLLCITLVLHLFIQLSSHQDILNFWAAKEPGDSSSQNLICLCLCSIWSQKYNTKIWNRIISNSSKNILKHKHLWASLWIIVN